MKPIFLTGVGSGRNLVRDIISGRLDIVELSEYNVIMNRKYRFHLRVELALICALSIGLSFVVGLIFGV